MPLAKCVRCDKLFDKTALPVCNDCVPAEEADYETIRTFLADHPDSRAELVSEATGVSVLCVLRMVDEGRILNATKASAVKCGRCGAPAISAAKKLCTHCLEELNKELLKQRTQIKPGRRKDPLVNHHVGVRQTLDAKREQKN